MYGGTIGRVTRLLGPLLEHPWTYALIDASQSIAPGMFLGEEMHDTYHFYSLNRLTKCYALIGDPVKYSVSDQTHNAFFREKGKNAIYVKIVVLERELKGFFRACWRVWIFRIECDDAFKEQFWMYTCEYFEMEWRCLMKGNLQMALVL